VSSIPPDNSQHRAPRTVTRIACPTEIALAASGIDLTDYTLAWH
jgi:hypothetical protein